MALRDMFRTGDEILEALRTRKETLGLSDAIVDELAGLTGGHWNKVAGPSRIKTPSLYTLMSVIGALGLAVQLVEDPESRVRSRWERRRNNNAHDNGRLSKTAIRKARPIVLSQWARAANAVRWSRTTAAERQLIVARLNAARLAKRSRRRTRKAA